MKPDQNPQTAGPGRATARQLGIIIGDLPTGRHNAITDVDGVLVGHTTVISGDGPLVVGEGPIRTGVTVVLPAADIWDRPVFAGSHRLNGNGEMTGLDWIRECGTLTTPVGITNSHSVGVVRDTLAAAHARGRTGGTMFWSIPVVGETYDGILNDTDGQHVRAEHVTSALDEAHGGEVAQGSVGGGTGMICHEFKGGIGSASRRVDGHVVGVLVQANHGRRERLTVNGKQIGLAIPKSSVPAPDPPERAQPGAGSIITIVATDAPLLPHQCTRLAQRAVLGIGRTGGTGEHFSGDLVLAFATGNRLSADVVGSPGPRSTTVETLRDEHLTPFFDAVVEATEEAILNAMLTADTMTGRDGVTAYGLEPDLLIATLRD